MEKAMRLLEFSKILEQLQAFTLSVPGREKAAALYPLFELEKVKELQKQTAEAVTIISQDLFDLNSVPDLEKTLQHLTKGGGLTATEFVSMRSFLVITETLKKNFLKNDRHKEKTPFLYDLIGRFLSFPHIISRINRCFDQHGEFREDASPLLLSLRQEEQSLQDKIRKALESYCRNPDYQKYLQENIITVRQNRYVLPVKQQFGRQIPGIVHDRSASGQTLFIEPFPLTELNNRLLTVRSGIEKEKERILRELSSLVRKDVEGISFNYELYGELDLILARGKLSILHEGNAPQLNEEGRIYIRGGRHPLLARKEAVPVDFYLGEGFNTLVITGPNTGGKTVTLKMVGLFVLMAQCGLHLPARPGSEISIFDHLWADIGDEQNISQSLSTFSGHMRNIIEIIQNASARSLVLLDELGAGTDPSEGSALAMAVLDELHRRGVRTVATTHINELKVFAHLCVGMENASMEFDAETLQPTFRLLIGVPGQSNALNVANRLGMPLNVLEKATSYLNRDSLKLDEAVSDLLTEKQKLARETQKVGEIKEELAFRLDKLTEQLNALEERKREILGQAREEAREMLRSTREKANEIVKKLHLAQREEGITKGLAMAEEARRQVQETLSGIGSGPLSRRSNSNQDIKSVSLAQIREGQTVYVRSMDAFGEIKRIVSAEEIQVGIGTFKVWTSLNDLGQDVKGVRLDKAASGKREKSTEQVLMWEKTADVLPHIDLRGFTLDEAILKMEKQLDDSILAGLKQILIIHGKGSGRLRRGLEQYLEQKRIVKSFRPGAEGEGGSGVTVVQLDN